MLERNDGVALIPPGLSYIFGDSGDGKSWVALIAATQCVRRGEHVIWVTYEDANEDLMVGRLKQLGVSEEEADRFLDLHIAFDSLGDAVDFLAQRIRERRTRLLVIDSLGEVLGVDGLDEDRDADFGPWNQKVIRRLIHLAAESPADRPAPNEDLAVLLLDHSTKAQKVSLTPSGTKRKRASVTGSMYQLRVKEPFGRRRLGSVELVTAKDRSGYFARNDVAAVVALDATSAPYSVAVEPPRTADAAAKRSVRERVLDAIRQSGSTICAEDVLTLVNRSESRREGEKTVVIGTVQNALTSLAKSNQVSVAEESTGIGTSTRNLYSVDHAGDDRSPPVDQAPSAA